MVWGGIHPTIAPMECLEHADMVVLGNGYEDDPGLLEEAVKIRDER